MTLKKYNIIIYFIILLNFVVNVAIAQENTLASPSPTISAKGPETTLPSSSEGTEGTENTENTENSIEGCLKSAACTNSNDTLKLCNGLLETPNEYIEKNITSGTYKPEDRGLARCMCNQPYYETLSKCIECFVKVSNTKFEVEPIEGYKEQCKKVGTTFTQTMPPISSTISPKIKWGLIGVVGIVVVGLIGFALFKRYKNKRLAKNHKISVEGGNLSTSNDKYPPPQSAQYGYQYDGYAPPSDTPYYPPPPGQDGQYPPPPPPPPQQHGAQGGQGGQYPPPPQQRGGGQGGQSDSYYDGSF